MTSCNLFTFAAMVLFATSTSPRLQHMAAWLGHYLFGTPLIIVTNAKALTAADAILNYSHQQLPFSCFRIQPHTLLFETKLQEQNITIQQTEGTTYFFETGGDFSFDILAASFYLMQRYEEYLPHQKDVYGRYAHTNSVAFKNNFLQLPLVDIWLLQFKKALHQQFPDVTFIQRHFEFLPTYDVDIAYSYRGKGWLRNAGGLFRTLVKKGVSDSLHGVLFLLTGGKDPFDVFEELHQLHQQFHLLPMYFFLLAQRQKGVDKNINPAKGVYRQLIQAIASQYQTGIHLSAAASLSPSTMAQEKAILAAFSQQPVTANRMHYLLFQLPETYRQLQQESLRITQEFSMGYGSINGFRASTCTPYDWYDLEHETGTNLRLFPFCYMEANSIFEQKDAPDAALEEMKHFLHIVRQVDGCFITIFHNHLIGRNEEGRKWMRMYRQFLSFLSNPNFAPPSKQTF